ncbi:outer membrane autotransporter protein [Luteibacter jiangsuensis]|uniref:Outer membrane autotransporter protein n=1 Tax=Luteibacter jiangsuensis TaxID=637577 RepID=A0ABT9T061_9GAMM|nr:autotransporter outer membrane beta-barrel domain-containing protein [Luteibacter jiangsuensis]MDQ0009597.1 outer membrane autotransporter protein [Luteibacter jiangsuensis]
MATVSCGRGALAMALVGALASPAQSTEWKTGILIDHGEAVQLDPGDIIHVSGDKTVGVRVASRATFDAEALTLVHEGATVPTGHAFGILAIDGAEVSLADSRIQLNGRRTIGVQAQRHATIELGHSSVEVSSGAGDRSIALALAGGTARLHGSSIDGGRGHAIATHFPGGGTAWVRLEDSTIRGRIGGGDVSLGITSVASRIDGDIVREGTGALDLRMARSAWRGKAGRLSGLSLEDSIWIVGGDSTVDTLQLSRGGTVAFDRTRPGFTALRVGTWTADAGASGIVLGTRLDAGGSLRRQATDRLLISGNASGSTVVHVTHAGGKGAATAGRDGSNGPDDGISLVQVGGGASAGSFQLAGDHVVVGPWSYALQAYEPGQSDARQRLVDGEGGGFWDFRLQSRKVEGPAQGREGRSRSTAPAMRPALAPQAPAYLVLNQALFGYGAVALDALRPHERDIARDPALRVRTFGGDVAYRSTLPFTSYGVDYRRHDRGVQVAGDFLVHAAGDTTWRVGVAASLGGSLVSPRIVDGRSEARVGARGVAVHAQLATEDGWQVAASYAMTHYRIGVRTPTRGEVLGRLRANGNDNALSAGYRWQVTDRLTIEPGSSLLWQRLRFSRAVDGDGLDVLGGTPRRVMLQSGARASLMLAPKGGVLYAWTPYLELRHAVVRPSHGSTGLSGERFPMERATRAAELSVGAAFHLWSRMTAHIDAVRRVRIGQGGEAGLTARAGLALTF